MSYLTANSVILTQLQRDLYQLFQVVTQFYYFTERNITQTIVVDSLTDSQTATCVSLPKNGQQTFTMYRKVLMFDQFIANITFNSTQEACDDVGYIFAYKDEEYMNTSCNQARTCNVLNQLVLADQILTCTVRCLCKTQHCEFTIHRSITKPAILCESNVVF